MNVPPIAYFKPLETAWNKMKNLLFRPFDLTRWLAIGFTAWLATLGEQGGSFNFHDVHHRPDVGAFVHEHMVLIITLGSIAAALILVLALVLVWLSARGEFMFLDNCLTGVARVAEPWQRWRRQGNSLFIWRMVYGCVILAVCVVLAGLCVALAWPDIRARVWGGRAIAAVVAGGLLLLLLSLVIGYVRIFLSDFVVVLMRRHELKTSAAWQIFLRLFRTQPGPFLLYGLLRFAVGLLIFTAVFLAGCLTCCCGFLMLAIPYVGTVLLLPLPVWQRYWGVEFLRQFGPDYDAWRLDPPALPPTSARPTSIAP
ncbi:MAG: hypothetical protein EPN23_02420 [Verrucomicrobia bacterium]|nr:MAG: hypothetical protein EPN23_02420 [Verrucomicrobiota bacterium]